MNAKKLIKRAMVASQNEGEFTEFRVVTDDIGGSAAIYNGKKFVCLVAGNRSQAWALIDAVVCGR